MFSNKDSKPSQAGLMAAAMHRLGKPFYEGTVPAHVKATRRAANRAARKARRAGR